MALLARSGQIWPERLSLQFLLKVSNLSLQFLALLAQQACWPSRPSRLQQPRQPQQPPAALKSSRHPRSRQPRQKPAEDAAAANIYLFHSRQPLEAAIKIAAYGHPAGLQNHAFCAVQQWAAGGTMPLWAPRCAAKPRRFAQYGGGRRAATCPYGSRCAAKPRVSRSTADESGRLLGWLPASGDSAWEAVRLTLAGCQSMPGPRSGSG